MFSDIFKKKMSVTNMINVIDGTNMFEMSREEETKEQLPFSATNETNNICNSSQNYWCENFGTQQIIEVIYLTLLTILGIFGNLLVICSISLEKKLFKQANIFIVNLAFADLVVSLYTIVIGFVLVNINIILITLNVGSLRVVFLNHFFMRVARAD